MCIYFDPLLAQRGLAPIWGSTPGLFCSLTEDGRGDINRLLSEEARALQEKRQTLTESFPSGELVQ